MPPIEIPPEYWTIEPAGFSVLVMGALPVVAAIDSELAGQHDGLTGAGGDDVQQQLGGVDGDAALLAEQTAQQTSAVVNTPTETVVQALPSGDNLSNTAEGQVAQAAEGAPSMAPAPSGGGGGDDSSPAF